MTATIHQNGVHLNVLHARGAKVNDTTPEMGSEVIVASWEPPLWAVHTSGLLDGETIAYSTEPIAVPVGGNGEFRFTLAQDDSVLPEDGRFTVTRYPPYIEVEWFRADPGCPVQDALGHMTLDEATAYADAVRNLLDIARVVGDAR